MGRWKLKNINGVTYVNDTLIVNKFYSLPKTYGKGLENILLQNFYKMQKDASLINLKLEIGSGFRSYEYQKNLYSKYCKEYGNEKTDSFSARPGHSEHQSGFAIDLRPINDSFINTKEGMWVDSNCFKYGFVIRYPQNQEHITGYKYEPWHLRYVGKDLAKILFNCGNWISMEELFSLKTYTDK